MTTASSSSSPLSPLVSKISSFFGCEQPPTMVPDDATPLLDSAEVLPAPDSTAIVMARCSDCNHTMPEANLAIHQATAHATRPSREPEAAAQTHQQEETPIAPLEELDSAPPPQKRNMFSDVMSIFQRRNTDGSNNDNRDTTLNQDEAVVDEWTCSRCTLLNPRASDNCSACNYARQEATNTTPDTTPRRQPASQRQASPPERQGFVPGSWMGGGALMGGILGALIGAASGNPLGGAVEGAMNGAMSGAFLESASRNQQQQQEQRRHQQQRHPNGMPMARVQFPDGSIRIVPLASLNRNQQERALRNAENMSYEQILQSSFRDAPNGNTNLGADERLIASIPTTKVENDAPKCDKCPICLESFNKNDNYKTLPCMHGFHAGCVDQWLRTNASCPLCKHSIS